MRGEYEVMSSTGRTLWSGNSRDVCIAVARSTARMMPGVTPGRWSFGTFCPLPISTPTAPTTTEA